MYKQLETVKVAFSSGQIKGHHLKFCKTNWIQRYKEHTCTQTNKKKKEKEKKAEEEAF